MMYADVRADAPTLYFQRVRPVLRELFSMAYAICGNYELAEYVLQRTVVEGFSRFMRFRGRMGLWESLRVSVRGIAVQEALRISNVGIEITWDGFSEDKIDGAGDDAVLRIVSAEDTSVRRMLIMRYGCALRAKKIARILEMPTQKVLQTLARIERRVASKLPAGRKSRAEALLQKAACAQLRLPSQPMPDPGAVFRSFEAEVSQIRRPKRVFQRATAILIVIFLAVMCAGAFWIAAVLLQPAVLEEDAAAQQTALVTEFET